MANEHDLRYKKLFSNPTLVKELFLFFVDEQFVGGLDFSGLERLDKSFISDEFKERESYQSQEIMRQLTKRNRECTLIDRIY